MQRRFSRLTRPDIRRLKPGERITEGGITAVRLRDGDLRYEVNIMVDGQRIHRVIGRESEGVTRTQAEQFVEARRTEAREGRLSLPTGRKAQLTFDHAADDYVARLGEISGKNLVAKRRQLRMHLKPFFGDQHLDRITKFTVDRYKKRRQDAGASAGTVNRELATLSHLFGAALEWKWIKARPEVIERLPERGGRIVVLTDDECDWLLSGAVADSDQDCWLFVMFGLNTAMRHSEILRVRFDQIDFDKLRLYVPQAKAGEREQPITPELAAVLSSEREMRDDQDGWIFPSRRPKESLYGHRTHMGRPFARAVQRAGLDPTIVTPHVMRHTAITNLVKAGADLPTIQKISGHKTLAMVLRYTHIHGAHIDRAISAIGRALPEPSKNNSADTVTPKLHTVPKKHA